MSVPPDFLFINAARIAPHRDGTYAPDANGEWAALMGVYDRLNELCDLVVWLLDHPSPWWLRVGDVCPLLGAGNIELAVICHEPIALYPTPQDWVLAAGRGACILDWDVCFAEIFSGVPGVECSTPALQRRLRQAFRHWEPPITIQRQEVCRAT